MSTLYQDLPYTTFPNTVQTFVTMQDILASDGATVKLFQDAMEVGDTALAQQYYTQITNADSKFINAEKMNTLFQTCVALQRFYDSDVESYVSGKQAEWQDVIDDFTYIGAFNSQTQYQVNNWVSFAKSANEVNLYLCYNQPPVGTLPTNTAYWRMLTMVGVQGVSGTGLAFTGEWASNKEYIMDDVVSYGNAVWACTTGNTNQIPAEGSNYWKLIYSVKPTIYPVQAEQPAGQSTGDLWFKVV